jgi:hypothetical protein
MMKIKEKERTDPHSHFQSWQWTSPVWHHGRCLGWLFNVHQESRWSSHLPINSDEVLIEYAQDGSSVTLHENLSFDSPLTCDSTSASNIWWTATPRPLRNLWIYTQKTKEDEYLKTSNKAQEFALKDAQEKKKKTFEELVPDYLHDFTDIFTKDGLNKLPPSHPGADHRIKTKPGFYPKVCKDLSPFPERNQHCESISRWTYRQRLHSTIKIPTS